MIRTMLECWNIAEQGLTAEEHGCRTSGIGNTLEDAGIPIYGPKGRSLQALLWSTATPKSNRVHLFLALHSATPEQVAESGLDRFFALRNALFSKSAEQPQLVEYVEQATRSLPCQALSVLR